MAAQRSNYLQQWVLIHCQYYCKSLKYQKIPEHHFSKGAKERHSRNTLIILELEIYTNQIAIPSSPALLPTSEGSYKRVLGEVPRRTFGERVLWFEGFSNAND